MNKVVARKLKPWEGQKLKRMKRQLSNAVKPLVINVAVNITLPSDDFCKFCEC